MKELRVYGPVSGPTGYDEVTRNIVKTLSLEGVNIHLIPFKGWSSYLVKLDVLTHTIIQQSMHNDISQSAPLLQIVLPEQLQLSKECLNINYTMFEADKIPQNWVDMSNKTDLTVVPSSFNEEVWRSSGTVSDLAVVPLGVDVEEYSPTVEPIRLVDEVSKKPLLEYKNRVLTVMEVTNRKNLLDLLRVFYNSVLDDDTCLIVKSSAYSSIGGVEGIVKGVQKEFKVSDKNRKFPPVYIYKQILPIYRVAEFFAIATHYLSMSCGEGWDLPAMQAGAMKKTLIVPNHTGYNAWLSQYDAYLIDEVQKEAANQEGAVKRLYKDSNWFRPSMLEGVERLKEALYGDAAVRECKAERLYTKIKSQYTWREVTKQLLSTIDNSSWHVSRSFSVAEVPKVDMVVPSWGKKCGIADYSRSLLDVMQKQLQVNVVSKPDILEYARFLDETDSNVIHWQLEYQWFSAFRFGQLLRKANASGKKNVVTMHTVNPRLGYYNKEILENADLVLVHNQVMKHALESSKVKVLPMGFNDLPKIVQKFDRRQIKTSKVVATFGFCYFHKGILELILSLKNLADTTLLILSSKPPQDTRNYYEQCQQLAKVSKRPIIWASDFLQEGEVLGYLQLADLVVLPYKEYGGLADSAALRTCMLAGRPVLTSRACFFDGVPESVIWKVTESNTLAENIQYVLQADNTTKLGNMKEFVKNNSWENIASKYVEGYTKVLLSD